MKKETCDWFDSNGVKITPPVPIVFELFDDFIHSIDLIPDKSQIDELKIDESQIDELERVGFRCYHEGYMQCMRNIRRAHNGLIWR